MPHEPLSPELALVDPELGARARAALPDRPYRAPARRPGVTPPPPEAPSSVAAHRHGYPFWARVTAALWLLVIGILIGGAAIPHAQDQPRIVPPSEDVPASICELPGEPAPQSPAPDATGRDR
jgi:hypothetical protein